MRAFRRIEDAFRASAHRWAYDEIRTPTIETYSLFTAAGTITLMKEGSRDLAPLVRDGFNVTNPANSLGFGWLFAYIVMSGSPVAAAALTFLEVGAIDQLGAFTMITGSRLGASFIVLFIGFIYVLRGRNRVTSLSMGLLSLTVTGTTYFVSLWVGLQLLTGGWLDAIQWQTGALLTSATDMVFDPIVAFFLALLPRWSLFLVGFGIIILSFSLFDKCLPQMSLKESQLGHLSRLVYQPWVMFLLGASITLISMSVSVSLSILVPMSQRGFVRRENVIPYIMGANITTFIDTLLAAVLLDNSAAFTVVLAEMLSITIVSLIVLALFYRLYQEKMLELVNVITRNNRNLAIFMVTILVVPIILLIL
jgi:Na+/phosphate symporter